MLDSPRQAIDSPSTQTTKPKDAEHDAQVFTEKSQKYSCYDVH
jgi:hypothetical protein